MYKDKIWERIQLLLISSPLYQMFSGASKNAADSEVFLYIGTVVGNSAIFPEDTYPERHPRSRYMRTKKVLMRKSLHDQ